MIAKAVRCHGLWVPAEQAHRFEAEFDGLPNLDVGKVARCSALAATFDTALDIGAHVGAVAAYLARNFRRVIAFEAIPSTYEFLARNAAELPNVEPVNVAVGSGPGEVFFTHYLTHGQLSHVASGADQGPKTEQIGPIPTRSIDSMNFTAVSFMKIDVEGYELAVVEGARNTILRCHPLILIEQGGNEQRYFGRPRHEASAFLESLGMRQHPDAPRMRNDRLYTFQDIGEAA